MNEKNKIIWFIKLHDYDKALKLIDDALLSEENEEEYENLKKNKIICLNGLCDWETLMIYMKIKILLMLIIILIIP